MNNVMFSSLHVWIKFDPEVILQYKSLLYKSLLYKSLHFTYGDIDTCISLFKFDSVFKEK